MSNLTKVQESLSMLPNNCLICFKPTNVKDVPDKSPKASKQARETLLRFFQLLGRHLGQDDAPKDYCVSGVFPPAGLLEMLSKVEMDCCESCSKVAGDFCDLYHQMKSIELLLNWKVWTLKSLMSRVGVGGGGIKKPASIKSSFKDLDIDILNGPVTAEEAINLFLNFRRELVEKCQRRLQQTYPKLSLQRCPSVRKTDASQTSAISPGATFYEEDPFLQSPSKDSSSHIKWERDLALLDDENSGEYEDHYLEDHPVLQTENAVVDPSIDNVESQSLKRIKLKAARRNYPFVKVTPPPHSQKQLGKARSTINPKTGKHTCSHCPKEYKNERHFRDHFEEAHLKIRYRCQLCGKEFVRRGIYIQHHEGVHLRVQHKCELCDKTFPFETSLNKHRQHVHSGNRDEDDAKPEPESHKNPFDNAEAESVRIRRLRGSRRNYPVVKVTPSVFQEAQKPHSILNPETGKYGCSLCPREYKNKSHFRDHLHQFHLKTRYKCALCGEEFPRRKMYNQHHESVHIAVLHKCNRCTKTFTLEDSLYRHKRKAHSILWKPEPRWSSFNKETGKYKCRRCPREFESSSAASYHHRSDHLKLRLKCSRCSREFRSRQGLLRHQRRDICGVLAAGVPKRPDMEVVRPQETFQLKESASAVEQTTSQMEGVGDLVPSPTGNQGIQQTEAGNPAAVPSESQHEAGPSLRSIKDPVTGQHKCPCCPREFKTESLLQRHHNGIHLKIKYKCNLCQREFSYQEVYDRHYEKVHKGIQFECHKCHKIFSWRTSLYHHRRLTSCRDESSKLKPIPKYSCEICGRDFPKPSTLRCHMDEVHRAVKDNLCSVCGKGFKSGRGLQTHMGTHSEARPHLCDICGKGFKTTNHLKNHRRQVHGGTEEQS